MTAITANYVCALLAVLAPASADDAKAVEERVAQLVKQLDDDKFVVRENATNELIKIGKPAVDALNKAKLAKPSQEMASRIDRILAEIDPKRPIQGAALVQSPDDRMVAEATGKTITIVDKASKKMIASLEGHAGNVTMLAFSPDGKSLFSGCEQGRLLRWDVQSNKMIFQTGIEGGLTSLSVSADGKTLTAQSGIKGIVLTWEIDAATGKTIKVTKQ